MNNLLGHICPLGLYPSPVLPVIAKDNENYAIYLQSNSKTPNIEEIKVNNEEIEIRYDNTLRDTLNRKDFDYKKYKLFAFNEYEIEAYQAEKEKDYFAKLLEEEGFSADNPFVRLSIAEATEDLNKVLEEMFRCIVNLQINSPASLPRWQKNKIEQLHKKYKLEIEGLSRRILENGVTICKEDEYCRMQLKSIEGTLENEENNEWKDILMHIRELCENDWNDLEDIFDNDLFGIGDDKNEVRESEDLVSESVEDLSFNDTLSDVWNDYENDDYENDWNDYENDDCDVYDVWNGRK